MNNWEKMSRFILEENCYMELSITGEWWYCERKNDDGTCSIVWMDSASEDAYDLFTAMTVAYHILYEEKYKK
ncbi:MAG: hypothetical protein MJZ00_07235 [Paludibacteraceae bacterium]|nr:hypothetical protein [Paludibacteraceae bacterium]